MPRSERLKGDRVFLAALLGALMACALPGLWAPPAFDDRAGVLENPRLRHPGLALEGFLTPAPRRSQGVLLPGYAYRPLTEASFALNAAVTGWSPAGLRAGNLLLHAASTLLVFLIARRLGAGLPPAFPRWAAFFFALHPLTVEAVTYLYQRATCLEAALTFLSLALYLGCRASPSRPRYAAAVGAGLLAQTSKETAVTLPLLLAACEWILRDCREPLRRVLARWLPFAVLPGLVLVQVLRAQSPDPASRADLTPLQYLRVQLPVLADYLRLNAFPFPLHFLHDRVRPLPAAGVATWLSGAALLALAAWALFGPVRHRLPRLGAALFLASQALESSVFPLWDIAATHRCYPGLLGLGLLFAWAQTRLPRACSRLALVALALFATLTATENIHWNLAQDLYARDLRHAWHAGVNWGNCAWAYLDTGHPEAARRVARQGARLPYNHRVGSAYVTALMALDRNEEARTEITRVKRLAEPLVWLRLATRESLQAGDPDRIEALMREAESLNLSQPDLVLWMARYWDRQGRQEEAEPLLRRTLALYPDHPLLWDHLGYLLFTRQRFAESEDAYRRAAVLDPSLYKVHYHLGLLALKRGDRQASEAAFRKALRAKPDYAVARQQLETLLRNPPRLAPPSGPP